MKKRIFVDTNILLDVLLERKGYYYDALKIWANAENGNVEACIAAISLNNIHYVMRKLKSETTAMIAVKILLRIFKVIPVDADILGLFWRGTIPQTTQAAQPEEQTDQPAQGN